MQEDNFLPNVGLDKGFIFDSSYSDTVLRCYDIWRQDAGSGSQGGEVAKGTRKRLRRLLLNTSELLQDSNAGWRVDRNNPGYLLNDTPPVSIRVPVHLVPVFPSRSDQIELWRLASQIKTQAQSTICLSGSGALKEMVRLIGDIDFCEYVPVLEDTVSLIEKKQDAFSPELTLFRVRLFGIDWQRSSSSARLDVPKESICPNEISKSKGKVDYFARTVIAGITEVTNVLIFCDKFGESKSLNSTFAHQETIFSVSDYVPQSLDNIYELGRYIEWLCGQTQFYLEEKNYTKALKRASSLSRICFFAQHTDKIFELLRSTTVWLDEELFRAKQNIEVLDNLPDGNTKLMLQKGLRTRIQNIEDERLAVEKSGRMVSERTYEKKASYLASSVVNNVRNRVFT